MTRFMTHTIKRQFTRQLGTRLILDSQARIIFLLSNKTTLQVKGALISEGLSSKNVKSLSLFQRKVGFRKCTGEKN